MPEMKFKVIRLSQNSEQRDQVDVAMVADPDWAEGRISFRLREDNALLEVLRYGTRVSIAITPDGRVV